MKPFGGAGDSIAKGVLSAEEALRYSMSLPVANTISGVEKLSVLQQNLEIAKKFTPMSETEMTSLRIRRTLDRA